MRPARNPPALRGVLGILAAIRLGMTIAGEWLLALAGLASSCSAREHDRRVLPDRRMAGAR